VSHSVDDQSPSLDFRLALQEPQPTIDRGKEVCDVAQNRFAGLAYNDGVSILRE